MNAQARIGSAGLEPCSLRTNERGLHSWGWCGLQIALVSKEQNKQNGKCWILSKFFFHLKIIRVLSFCKCSNYTDCFYWGFGFVTVTEARNLRVLGLQLIHHGGWIHMAFDFLTEAASLCSSKAWAPSSAQTGLEIALSSLQSTNLLLTVLCRQTWFCF